jgi:hypothetical protein
MFWSCVFGLALVSSVGAQCYPGAGVCWTDSEYKVASDGTVSVRSGNLKAVKKPAGSTKNQWQKITNSPGLKGGYYANIQVGGRSGLLLSHPNNGAYTGEQQPSSSHKFAVLVHDGSGDAIGDFERDGGFGELKLSPLNVRTSGRASKIFEEDLEADGDYERGHADGSVFLELGESLEYPIGTRRDAPRTRADCGGRPTTHTRQFTPLFLPAHPAPPPPLCRTRRPVRPVLPPVDRVRCPEPVPLRGGALGARARQQVT